MLTSQPHFEDCGGKIKHIQLSLCHFLLIVVSFSAYFVIYAPDKMLSIT